MYSKKFEQIAYFLWAKEQMWDLCKKTSNLLFYHERPERIAHGCSFVMSDLRDALMVALIKMQGWASVLFKRTQRSCMYIYIYLYIYILKKRTQHSAFFCKRTKRSCVLLCSLQKNKTFSAFFYVLCKRTLRSLRSFTFFAKECCVLCVLLRS